MITELSQHEADRGEFEEGEGISVEVLPVLGQPAASVQPGDGAFDDPAFRQHDEAFGPVGSFDDLGIELGEEMSQGAAEDRSLIGAVGEQFGQEGIEAEQRCQ